MVINNPKYGWCDFKLGDFNGRASYLTDVPVDLLEAFIDYFERGQGVVVFDEEGSYFTLILTRYNWGIYLIEDRDETVLHDFSDMDINTLAKELIDDIENDLVGWSNEFAICGDDDPEELAQHRNEIRQRIAKLKIYVNY